MKSCASSGIESATTTTWPRRVLTNVHVTVSPGPTSTFAGELPSSQVALVASQPGGVVCETEYPLPAERSLKVRLFDSAGSESSSREKLVGDRPPPAEKAKSCGSVGCESSFTTMSPCLVSVHVQVTVSPAATSMLPGVLPSSHVAELRSQPPWADCATE